MSQSDNRRQTRRPTGGARRVIPGGRITPRDTLARQRAANEVNPMLTEGDAAINTAPLLLERFAGWARYPRIGMCFEGLRDRQGALRWDVARALHVACAVKHVFISCNDGCYQVENDIMCDRCSVVCDRFSVVCDRFSVPSVAEDKFVSTMAAYLGGEGREEVFGPYARRLRHSTTVHAAVLHCGARGLQLRR